MSEASMNMSPTTAIAVRDPWALVPSLGNLDAYISAVNRLPLLTQEEEVSLARRLRATPGLDGVVLIAVTGYGDEQAKQQATTAGFDHHFVKPIDPASLVALVATLA